jgi:hypothetical protein
MAGDSQAIPVRGLKYQARKDNATLAKLRESCPQFDEVAGYFKRVCEVLDASGEFLRVPAKAAILALMHVVAPLIGDEKIDRIFSRRKEAAICWFCLKCPTIVKADPAVTAAITMKGLDVHRRRSAGIIPPRRHPKRRPGREEAAEPPPWDETFRMYNIEFAFPPDILLR